MSATPSQGGFESLCITQRQPHLFVLAVNGAQMSLKLHTLLQEIGGSRNIFLAVEVIDLLVQSSQFVVSLHCLRIKRHQLSLQIQYCLPHARDLVGVRQFLSRCLYHSVVACRCRRRIRKGFGPSRRRWPQGRLKARDYLSRERALVLGRLGVQRVLQVGGDAEIDLRIGSCHPRIIAARCLHTAKHGATLASKHGATQKGAQHGTR